jgi:hypothetical protein
VVIAAMFLTAPFEIGFGKETLGEKFLLMVPGNDEKEGTGIGLGKSLGPLTTLVKKIIGWEDEENDNNNTEEMVVD